MVHLRGGKRVMDHAVTVFAFAFLVEHLARVRANECHPGRREVEPVSNQHRMSTPPIVPREAGILHKVEHLPLPNDFDGQAKHSAELGVNVASQHRPVLDHKRQSHTETVAIHNFAMRGETHNNE